MWDTLQDGKGKASGNCTEPTTGCYQEEEKVGIGDLGRNKLGETQWEGTKRARYIYFAGQYRLCAVPKHLNLFHFIIKFLSNPLVGEEIYSVCLYVNI